MKNSRHGTSITNHHVILTKYGADVLLDETTRKSDYSTEKGRIENVLTIKGNIPLERTPTLTQTEIVELRDILDVVIEKERNRVGADPNWGKQQSVNKVL